MQCIGRIPAKDEVYFTSGPRLHRNKPLLYLLPKRCSEMTKNTLCGLCTHKRGATLASIEKRGAKYIPNQGSLLHGTILEPIPNWSRLYKGVWYLEQITKGYELSPDVFERSEKAYNTTHKDGECPPVEMPKKKDSDVAPVKAKRATKASVATVKPLEPLEVVQPVAPVEPIKPVVKRMAKKTVTKVETVSNVDTVTKVETTPKSTPKPFLKSVKSSITHVGKISDITPIIPSNVITVNVKKTTLDGRTVYINYKNDKVYDMKFNYIGRSKNDAIDSSFPDSDAEV